MGNLARPTTLNCNQGKGSGISQNHTNLGLGGLIVLRLVENVPEHEIAKIFFDNSFTSVQLLLELKSLEILSLGVVRGNGMAGANLRTSLVGN